MPPTDSRLLPSKELFLESSSSHQVTVLLRDWRSGNQTALEKLTPLIYSELRRLAHSYMKREKAGHPLQTTALVHEAYMRLIDAGSVDWKDRAHFYGISARLMRQILVEFGRSRSAGKRGGDARHVELDEAMIASIGRDADLVALDDALTALAAIDAREAQVVEMRFFGGLSVEETAEVLAISRNTVLRDWNHAKAWLLNRTQSWSMMMSNERWERVKQIFNSALECEPDGREDFLREACGGDESLRKEVEVLFAHQGELSGFMKAPAMEVAAQVLAKGSGSEDIESMVGRSVAHYGIVEKIGEGGMGIVYKAHDTRLNRSVAIKALPDIFAADPERLARFEREAKALASLNHPNIASVYGLEKSDGKSFLVMELVEGKTLADRLKKGRIPLDETLEICRQIAEGIEAAHEKGILHRDLKPANIQITLEWQSQDARLRPCPRASGKKGLFLIKTVTTTITHEMTRTGVILGTAAYMSPEQAKGAAVDRRADIWAFGCVFYECLTGKRPFDGATATETLAAVLTCISHQ